MNIKLLSTAAVALCIASGAALAQQSPAEPGNVGPSADNQITNSTGNYASDDERMMYEENGERMRDFFMDDSMTTMKSEDEIKSIFSAMGADDQAGIKAACDRVEQGRSSYGQVTQSLCAQVMTM